MNYLNIIIFVGLAIVFGFYLAVSRRPKSKAPKIPLGFVIAFLILRASVPVFRYFDLGQTANSIDVAASVVICMAVVRIIVYLIVDFFLRQKKGVQIPTISRDFGLAIAYIVIAMIVLKHKTDVNLGSLLTTSAILTAVIGFAMQDTLGNLFSGLALQLEHPYQIGDWIGFEGLVGKVTGITWKSTKILTGSEEMIFVPNNTIAKSTLKNFSRPTHVHQAFIEVGVDYNEPPHKVMQALISVMKDHPKVLEAPPADVRITRYDASTINYKAIFATEDFATEERTKAEILNSIWYRFKREGIKIPYPIQEQIQTDPNEIKTAEEKRRREETDDILRTLGEIDVFKGLPMEVRTKLAAGIRKLRFAPNETIVTQGEKTGPMYIISEGSCGVYVSHDGREMSRIVSLGEKQFFGEMSLLTGDPRTATVKAEGYVTCLEIDKDDLRDLFASYPSFVSSITEYLIQRQEGLDHHRAKTVESERMEAEKQSQLISKIRSFFGL